NGSWNAKGKGMGHEIRADYEQIDLLPQCLEDWVSRDHPARFIREFVDALDLGGLGFVEHEGEEGRPAYANDLLLKVWLYGYLARIRSTRQLERACREHLSLIWLTGRHAPDHNTLWRFWAANRKALRGVFRAGVKVAAAQGLVGMICQAVDGTKIRAVASTRRVEHQDDLEKLLARVEASIAEMEKAVEAAEQEVGGEYRLPERLQQASELRAAIRESLEKMQGAGREHLHPQEPEARLMPCEGRLHPAYNAQAVADAQAGVVVAAEVVNAESDHAQLVPMLEEVQANLGEVAKETVADGGYASAAQLGEAEARGQEVLVAPGVETGGAKRGELDSQQFTYDREADEVICPQGKRLRFAGLKKKGSQRSAVRSYRCTHYAQCPVRALCSGRKDGRRIEVSPQRAAVLRQRAKRRDPAKQALLRQRKVIIEPVFATLKQAMGFRRWTVRGLENVRTQWALLCTAFNLKKMYRYWVAARLTVA
ncbi:MAG TPA: IS1182 family transposase, partial [Terriglobales bacterium]|nr:IS1182 family transposase [Terriglobales bacterium]